MLLELEKGHSAKDIINLSPDIDISDEFEVFFIVFHCERKLTKLQQLMSIFQNW